MSKHEESHDDELGFDLPQPAKLGPARAVALALVFLVLVAGAFVVGFLPKRQAAAELDSESKRVASARKVEVVTPKELKSDRALNLSGNVQPIQQTILYPRASGYVRDWKVDLGAKVSEGDVLAEIDTPDLDQEILQARAQQLQAQAGYTRAKASSDFSKIELERSEKLASGGVGSQQDVDSKRARVALDAADMGVAGANIEAMRANVERLEKLKSFAKVLAPFSGTITARTVERGALVTAGNASPLFTLSALDTVRVLVQVPQDVAAGVKTEQKASVSIRSLPGRTFDGVIAHAAGALDPATRMMTVEVRVPNEKGELLPGMYALVALNLPIPHRIVEIPSTALFNDANGLRVATVAADDTIVVVPVTLERDLGATLEIASGLPEGARVVRLAAIDLVDGRLVEPVTPPPPEKKP